MKRAFIILALLAMVVMLGGCSGNDRMCRVSYRGGAHPAIWLHTSTPSGTPTLTGKELLRVARAMFGIGQPVMEDQMRLL